MDPRAIVNPVGENGKHFAAQSANPLDLLVNK
jgi:hypothetical protein